MLIAQRLGLEHGQFCVNTRRLVARLLPRVGHALICVAARQILLKKVNVSVGRVTHGRYFDGWLVVGQAFALPAKLKTSIKDLWSFIIIKLELSYSKYWSLNAPNEPKAFAAILSNWFLFFNIYKRCDEIRVIKTKWSYFLHIILLYIEIIIIIIILELLLSW